MNPDEYVELLNDYWMRFGEGFPTEIVENEEKQIRLIKAALKSGQPYDPYEAGDAEFGVMYQRVCDRGLFV